MTGRKLRGRSFQSPRRVNRWVQSHFVFLHILPKEACELHQPVVLLSGSQPETAHPFTFNLPFAAFRSPGIHFVTSALLSHPKNQPSSKVSEMQCQACTLCAIWISVFVAKQQASEGFHYKSKSQCVMQLSRLWDEAGCGGGTPPHPLPVCACH